MEASTTTADWLNYHHLRYFYAVAKEGSVRRAAEVLSISQPSICAQVKLLESALGESLFRRSGRSLVLTDFGQVILGYAEEIFTLGRELLGASTQVPTIRSLRLQVGIVDSFPKLLSFDILRPAFTHQPPAHLSCREGKLDDLLGQLAAHRLDAVLADEPPPSSTKIRTFNHALASSGVTFCATPSLARQLVGKFPRNLHGSPALLPTQNTTLRRDLEKWFRDQKIEPKVVAEFEDAALATIVATEGMGFTVVPTIIVAEAVERYGFVPLGKTEVCQIRLYLITAERRMDHPLVQALAQHAAASLSHRAAGRRRKTAKPRKSARP